MRAGKVNVMAASIGVWESSVDENAFRAAVFSPLIAFLRARGWQIGADPHVLKNFRSISKNHRVGEKGPLRAELNLCGRHIEVKWWSEDFAAEPGRHRYEFDVRDRMPPQTRRRLDNELARACEWLWVTFGYSVDNDHNPRVVKTALDKIAVEYRTSWHVDAPLGHPAVDPYNNKTADGLPLRQRATVWTRRRDGRVVRGTLYIRSGHYHAVVCNGHMEYADALSITYAPPSNLRRCISDDVRRERLETEMNRSILNESFQRAETLRRVLFGDAPTYRLRHKDKGYYAPQARGYRTREGAGRFTAEEAARYVAGSGGELAAEPIGNAPVLVRQ